METNQMNSLNNRHQQDKKLVLDAFLKKLETKSGKPISYLKENYGEEKLFLFALFHVTTTKKLVCEALNIPVEAACRYKRHAEDHGGLVESDDTVLCPLTKHPAKLLSTNPNEFSNLSQSSQLKIF